MQPQPRINSTGGKMMNTENNDLSLADLIERGGVYHRLAGALPADVLSSLIQSLPPFPGVDSAALLRAALEREALMPTGIGRGIAVPHPRNPMLDENAHPFVALGFPAAPVDWHTPDGSNVHALFLLVSNSAHQHLCTLSKINFLCQQEKISSLIKAHAPRDEIIAAIRETEQAWI
jgi:PTS system nitrogen regulatory IIA component